MKNPWEELLDLLEEEKKAIIRGDVKALLECVEKKETLLKDPALKEVALPKDLRDRLRRLTEHNQMLLKAGLAFIEEAYRFLGRHLSPSTGYGRRGQEKGSRSPKFISCQV